MGKLLFQGASPAFSWRLPLHRPLQLSVHSSRFHFWFLPYACLTYCSSAEINLSSINGVHWWFPYVLEQDVSNLITITDRVLRRWTANFCYASANLPTAAWPSSMWTSSAPFSTSWFGVNMIYRSLNFANGPCVARSIENEFWDSVLMHRSNCLQYFDSLKWPVLKGVTLFYDSVHRRSAAEVVNDGQRRYMYCRAVNGSHSLRSCRSLFSFIVYKTIELACPRVIALLKWGVAVSRQFPAEISLRWRQSSKPSECRKWRPTRVVR